MDKKLTKPLSLHFINITILFAIFNISGRCPTASIAILNHSDQALPYTLISPQNTENFNPKDVHVLVKNSKFEYSTCSNKDLDLIFDFGLYGKIEWNIKAGCKKYIFTSNYIWQEVNHD